MKLSPSSVLIFSSVGVDIISKEAPSRTLNIGVNCGVLSVWIGGGLGVNKGQSDASSSLKINTYMQKIYKISHLFFSIIFYNFYKSLNTSFVSMSYTCNYYCILMNTLLFHFSKYYVYLT